MPCLDPAPFLPSPHRSPRLASRSPCVGNAAASFVPLPREPVSVVFDLRSNPKAQLRTDLLSGVTVDKADTYTDAVITADAVLETGQSNNTG